MKFGFTNILLTIHFEQPIFLWFYVWFEKAKMNETFLSDPSPIIGYVCHSLTHWLTNWLTYCCFVNLIDETLACEDANSKFVEVVTVADVSDEDRVHVADLEAEVWS